MDQWQRPLRVMLIGPQDNFGRVLATNIHCWGHEVLLRFSALTLCGDEASAPESDVLIYDLDASFQTVMMGKDSPSVQRGYTLSQVGMGIQGPGRLARLTIVLSSRSVSRTTLEQIGAVALLQKPFEMGLLQRYLRVFQRLLLPATEAGIPCENRSTRVLVAEDDVDIAYAVEQCLSYEEGYEVVVAHDGLEALELCLDWRPQCIVTDLLMPWMNGYQVMRCLSIGDLIARPAFVVMSALTQLEVPVNRSYLQGAAIVYVDKPFHIDHLLTVIKRVCAGE